MRNNWIFIIYYIYALIVIFLSGYVVFVLDHSGAWFIVTLLLLSITPETKE